MDKSKGVQYKKWDLIPKEPYWNALTNYMQYGEAFRTPETLIDSWLELIAKNTVTLSHMTEIFGHSMSYPTDELIDIFFYEREDEAPQDYEGWCEFLEELGFFEWCMLPDGSDAISDYGIEPIFKILNTLKSDATKGEKTNVRHYTMLIWINEAGAANVEEAGKIFTAGLSFDTGDGSGVTGVIGVSNATTDKVAGQ